MSFSWEGRHNRPLGAPAYGGSGAIDTSVIFNDPRFAETVQDAVRRVATMQGAFPHGSIDPRALIPVPAVTTLPAATRRHEGMVVEFWPSGTVGSGVMWTCIWRGAANSGSGAWMVVGGGPPVGSNVITDQNVTGTTSPVVLTGNSIETPVPGLYGAEAHIGGMSVDTAGGSALAVAARANDLPPSGSGFLTETTEAVPGSSRRLVETVTGDLTINLYGLTANAAHTATFNRRRLLVYPIELRP